MIFTKTGSRVALACVMTLCHAAPSTAAELYRGSLVDGVLVDNLEAQIYLMGSTGTVEAIDPDSGNIRWENLDFAKPLAILGSGLLAQAEGANTATTLGLGLIDVSTGRTTQRLELPLPSPLRTLIDDGLGVNFNVRAEPNSDGFQVLWQYSNRPVRGAWTDDLEQSAPSRLGGEPSDSRVITQQVLVRPDGSYLHLKQDDKAFPRKQLVREISVEDHHDRFGGPYRQFLSVDGTFILISERIADASHWDRYEWTIVEQNSEALLGSITAPTSTAPFIIIGSKIVFESKPYIRVLDQEEVIQQPLSLLATDLANGVTMWKHPIRDTKYAGPYPP